MHCKHCTQVDFSFNTLIKEVLGIPRAIMHFKHLENQSLLSKKSFKDVAIGLIELIPILGGLVSLVEGVAIPYFFPENPKRHPNHLWKNMVKAAEEHRAAYQNEEECPYATKEILKHFRQQALIQPIEQPPLEFDVTVESIRKYNCNRKHGNEDRALEIQSERGLLVAVFDGHGGKEVAEYAKEAFQERFLPLLEKEEGDVVATFEQLTHDIDEEIGKKFEATLHALMGKGFSREGAQCCGVNEWGSGSTAVVSWIDAKTHKMTTMTLGDSEANIYREYEEKMVSIPCSPIRDWTSPKDQERAKIALSDAKAVKEWSAQRPSNTRFPGPANDPNTNVSRAFGDHALKRWNGKPGLIHKPKYTEFFLQADDVVVLASDGLKDYFSESEIVKEVTKPTKNSLAESIAEINVTHHRNPFMDDDTTVVAVAIS